MGRTTFWAIMGLTLGLMGGVMTGARSDAYPYQGQTNFSLDGSVQQVDVDRDRVVLTGDNGRTYTIDTYQCHIALRDTDRPGTTADLVPGMRLHITGVLASSSIVEAEQVTVQPYRDVRPIPRPTNSSAPVSTGHEPITLRGTVESVDNNHDRFVVHVRDHSRTVYINDQTDLEDLDYGGSGDQIPLHSGDRVTVAGTFRADGTVLASSVRGTATASADGGGVYQSHPDMLTGPVTQPSNRYSSRDIKIRVAADRVVTVHVPHNVPIRREGHSISVHDLGKSDVVRIEGRQDGDDFKATRIDVLHTNDEGY